MKKTTLSAIATAMAIGLSGTAYAGVVINNPAGTLLMGINDNGSLNYGTGVTSNGGSAIAPDGSGGGPGSAGIAFKFPDGTYRDATSPGCLCEGSLPTLAALTSATRPWPQPRRRPRPAPASPACQACW